MLTYFGIRFPVIRDKPVRFVSVFVQLFLCLRLPAPVRPYFPALRSG